MITLQELVQREVIYCVSSLVHTLTQQNKLDEELAYLLWQGQVDYEAAEHEINQAGGKLQQEDGYWGIYGTYVHYWLIDPVHKSKEDTIDNYFDGDLDSYRSEVFEHWIVSSWLALRLIEHGETVVEDVLGIDYIWGRTTTGQVIHCDYVIQTIYKELIRARSESVKD